LNGLRVSEAADADIEHLGLERGHRRGALEWGFCVADRAGRNMPRAIRPQMRSRSEALCSCWSGLRCIRTSRCGQFADHSGGRVCTPAGGSCAIAGLLGRLVWVSAKMAGQAGAGENCGVPAEERKLATVLFADLVGSTELADHPDTLATRGNLAGFTGGAGNAAAARDQFTALLPIRERVSGPGHPDTLAARANLAYWSAEAERSGNCLVRDQP